MKLSSARAALAAFALLFQPIGGMAAQARAVHSAAAHAAHPALWRIQGRAGGTIWLFGTIHALPPHFEWESPAVRAAVAGSDRLVLEAVTETDPAKSAALLMKLAIPPAPLPPVAERIRPKFRESLEAMAAKSAIPLAQLDGMKTWAVGMVLFGVTMGKLGVSGADGVEQQLRAQFTAAGKPVEGLETVAQQLGFFDTMSETQQRAFLESVLDGKGDDLADFGKMLGAWSHGNEKGIQAAFDADMGKNETLREVLLSRRNAHWADAIVSRLAMPGTQFLAVGAGHLVGPQSVQAKLARLGYRAVRVE
jgi:uncharacterized protein YbaP (TraB family)